MDIHPLGQLLGLSEDTLAAIDSYYDDHAPKVRHTVAVWLINSPDDPVTQLRDALTTLGEDKVSETLKSLGELKMSVT